MMLPHTFGKFLVCVGSVVLMYSAFPMNSDNATFLEDGSRAASLEDGSHGDLDNSNNVASLEDSNRAAFFENNSGAQNDFAELKKRFNDRQAFFVANGLDDLDYKYIEEVVNMCLLRDPSLPSPPDCCNNCEFFAYLDKNWEVWGPTFKKTFGEVWADVVSSVNLRDTYS